MRRRSRQYVWAVGLALALPLVALAVVTYTGFDYVGVLFGTTKGTATITEAFAINNQGTIVGGFCADADPKATTPGCAAPGNAPSHGYVRFKKGNVTKFKAINFPGSFETETTGINNGGTIIGLYDPKMPVPANADTGNGFYCEFSASKGCEDFHTVVYPGSKSTDLQAINEKGDIVGIFALQAIPPFKDFGFLLDNGKFCSVDLGTAIPGAGDTNTLGINDLGDIVGSYDDPTTGVTAFLITDVEVPKYKDGKPQSCTWTNLSTFVFAPDTTVLQTEAAGINEHGLIVGNYLDGAQVSHAFQVQSLPNGTLDTTSFLNIDFAPAQAGDNAASSLNNKGVIIGNYEDTTTTPNVIKERAWIRKP